MQEDEKQPPMKKQMPAKSKVNKVSTPTQKKQGGSADSKGSKGSTGSATKIQKPTAPVSKPVVIPKNVAPPKLPTQPQMQMTNAQVAQMSNAQVAQMQQMPVQQMQMPVQQMQMPMMQMMNRGPPRRQGVQEIKMPNVFNDDQPLPEEVEKPKEKAKEVRPYDLETSLLLEIKARQKIVKLNSKQAQLMPVVVNVKTKDMEEDQEGDRSAIDLICVMDVSGSMSGQKIALVRDTMKSLLDVLSDRDRLCLVRFDDRAERMTPLLRVSKENFEVFKSNISLLQDRGGTNIANGMDMAFRVLRERKYSNPVSGIFLLTDGLDGGAHQRVSACMVERKLLEDNFTINCFGFGRDHDEDLLNNISKLKDGNFYFIDKLDTVDQCFASALGGLMSVVATNIEIFVRNSALKPFEQIMIKKTFGQMWDKKGVTSGYQITQPQLLAGAEKGYMLEIQIPALTLKVGDLQRNVCILDVDLSAKDKSGTKIIKKSAKLILQIMNEDEELGQIEQDGEVMENYFRVKGAEAIEEAVKMANIGKYQQGRKNLDAVIEQISVNKKVNQVKMKPMMEQLVSSKESCQERVYQAVGKKCMVANQKQFFEQKAQVSNAMYSNSMQTKMVSEMKSKKMN